MIFSINFEGGCYVHDYIIVKQCYKTYCDWLHDFKNHFSLADCINQSIALDNVL